MLDLIIEGILYWIIGSITLGTVLAVLVVYKFYRFCKHNDNITKEEVMLGADAIFLTEEDKNQVKIINKEKEDGY